MVFLEDSLPGWNLKSTVKVKYRSEKKKILLMGIQY